VTMQEQQRCGYSPSVHTPVRATPLEPRSTAAVWPPMLNLYPSPGIPMHSAELLSLLAIDSGFAVGVEY
jgi:hypothetical protein